ncbi:putative inorganic carbon transporter subunit DabA, partial [Actinotalea ferrariae]|uniref:putative inorganic carbon transporter subunit DabA n=1 Tax=Actinotalea ferrariae TaxID=1386098 RepID=UPI001C1DD53C
MSSWLAAWTDTGDTPWPAPGRDQGLWDWFRLVATQEPSLRRALVRAGALPARADADSVRSALPGAAADLLGALAADHDLTAWARTELLRLPGWAGFLG